MTVVCKQIGLATTNAATWNPRSASNDDYFTYIDLSSVDREAKAVTAPQDMPCNAAPSRARQLVKTGDVLVATVRPNLNGVALIGPELDGATASTGFCVLRPDPTQLDSRYLYYWVSAPPFVREMTRRATGQSYPAVSDRIIKASVMPLPNLEEQIRIAVILNMADNIRRKRAEVLRLADDFLKSVFLDMFGDPVLNPRNWPTDTFGSVGELDRGRSRHRPRNAPELLDGPYPLVQTGDIANAGGYIRGYTQTYSEIGLAQSKMWPAGTLCITIAANIAKTAILALDACFPDSVVGFRPNGRVRTEYIQYWLSFLQKIIEDNAPESAQKNINLAILRSLSVPIPLIDLQDRFVDIVGRTESMKGHLGTSHEECDKLFGSLVQRAFRGRL